MAKVRGNNQVSGTWGQVWWDGELVLEVETFKATITANREKVQIGMDEDSKITGLKGEISFKVKKFYSRGKKAILEAWKAGKDPRSSFVSALSDPDTINNQEERISIDNVWFDDLTLADWEKGKPVEEEYKGGFTPSDASFMDTIAV